MRTIDTTVEIMNSAKSGRSRWHRLMARRILAPVVAVLPLWSVSVFPLIGETNCRVRQLNTTPPSEHDFRFDSLAKRWDEGIPLGNGMLGALIWQKGTALRFALDRADLWDLRKVKEFERPEFRFSWVIEQVNKGDYKPVQDLSDEPYRRDAAPTKLPGGALEFDLPGIEDVTSVGLNLERAVCVVKWKNGVQLETFVHATEPRGWYRFTGLSSELKPRLVAPSYQTKDSSILSGHSGPEGNDLRRLGYPSPEIVEGLNETTYHQECADGFSYTIWIGWSFSRGNTLVGCWTITPNRPYPLGKRPSRLTTKDVTEKRFFDDLKTHADWWRKFWSRSSIRLPDSILERQWYRELYKFGSASRRGAPPITLQAVWTADNDRLPPWKGDFHNDLNTQLSYWPCYSGNHLEEGLAFLDWLWQCMPVAERYTKTFFEVDGLNFPGVATLTGDQMGGWIQYSLSPTVSAWLAHHFYLHWRYSMDREFLKKRAYPWLRSVAEYIEKISVRDAGGKWRLPLSSSPEINDNRIDAWFHATTNYDLALVRWLYRAAAELAVELGNKKEADRWIKMKSEWPDLALSGRGGKLLVAPGYELRESHRHFSHLMAIHPLGMIDWDGDETQRDIIRSSLADLERLGTDWWCGYSYAWLGSLWARACNGEKAAEALRTFATCFCLPNSFHVNGDQSGTGKSKFTYRPFTLEGNFACAAGIQEMLLQSQGGILRVFPAVPRSWKDVSFTGLRAEGAFLVTAEKKNGAVRYLRVESEKGGIVRLMNPFGDERFEVRARPSLRVEMRGDTIECQARPGTVVEFFAKTD